MEHRDRAAGWKHAKISGHLNEDELANRLRTDMDFARKTGARIWGYDQGEIVMVEEGGISAKKVASVLGGFTTGKPDLIARWSTGKIARISIKKSSEGQAFLISVERFCKGFEKQYGIKVPAEVEQFLNLFIGGDRHIIEAFLRGRPMKGPKLDRHQGELLEMHQERLTIATISEYAPHLISATIDWFSQTLHHIYNFVYSKGLAELQEDHASDIWYWSPPDGLDDLFSIQQELDTTESSQLYFGSRNGGTVFYMPFGPVQMHKNEMQFRHRHQDIAKLGKQS